MIYFKVIVIFCLVSYCLCLDQDIELTVPQLILKSGYPAEVHPVTTEDGYIITMHRIPYSKNDDPNSAHSQRRPIIFLQHGVLASSDAWVLIGPENGLAFLLSDQGFDVWMGNSRGNTYSLGHKKLNLKHEKQKKKYWNFSFHEMGYYDLPANIDYILAKTNQSQLFYVGHSQGCATFFVMSSLKPQYNNKIISYFGLAPAIFVGNLTSPPLRLLANINKFNGIAALSQILGYFDVTPHTYLLSSILARECRDGSVFQPLCLMGYFIFGGYDPAQINPSFLPMLFGHFPAGSSSKQLIHYSQEINSGDFRQYDYGFKMNKKMYGSETPPNYPLELVTTPVHLYYGRNDWLEVPKDVHKLEPRVNLVESFEVPFKNWAHNDFTYGTDVKELVYEKLISDIQKYLKN